MEGGREEEGRKRERREGGTEGGREGEREEEGKRERGRKGSRESGRRERGRREEYVSELVLQIGETVHEYKLYRHIIMDIP